ncbi:MAG: hypothetical protein RML35_09180 [Chloroherpetonaceae bacterium]|nr:hypothetical protein [Chloroherpetonaceae bacterium]MDW8466327.1 hypothetical protein [Chloroherpetonaceae bacterium]
MGAIAKDLKSATTRETPRNGHPAPLAAQTVHEDAPRKEAPTKPGDWTLAEIQAALKRELPASLLKTRKQDNVLITYIDWHTVNKILDKYAPGWTWEIKTMALSTDRIFLVGRLTIPAADGVFYREATGTESLHDFGYGDPSSNAESMCFRRAAAKFGLGLYLYEK